MTPSQRLRRAIDLYRAADDRGDGWARVGAYAHLRAVVLEIGST